MMVCGKTAFGLWPAELRKIYRSRERMSEADVSQDIEAQRKNEYLVRFGVLFMLEMLDNV